MALDNTVTALNITDLIEFDPAARLVRKKLIQSELIVAEIACYAPGQETKLHIHPNQDEIFYCVSGRGLITFADQADEVLETGGIVFVPKGCEHGVGTIGDDKLVLMFTKGPGLPNPKRQKK